MKHWRFINNVFLNVLNAAYSLDRLLVVEDNVSIVGINENIKAVNSE